MLRRLESNPNVVTLLQRKELYPAYLFRFNSDDDSEAEVFSLTEKIVGPFSEERPNPNLLLLNEDKYDSESLDDLPNFLDFASHDGRPKIVLINNLDRMSLLQQNSFLKVLEDAYYNVSFFLTTKDSTQVLDTIKSRSVLVDCPKMSEDHFSDIAQAHQIPQDKIAIYYRIFNGDLSFRKFDNIEMVRFALYKIFYNTNSPDILYNLSVLIPETPYTLQDLVKQYSIVPLVRMLRSFYLDRILVLLGSEVRYNTDYAEYIKNMTLTFDKASRAQTRLSRVEGRGSSNFNYLWLKGVLLVR